MKRETNEAWVKMYSFCTLWAIDSVTQMIQKNRFILLSDSFKLDLVKGIKSTITTAHTERYRKLLWAKLLYWGTWLSLMSQLKAKLIPLLTSKFGIKISFLSTIWSDKDLMPGANPDTTLLSGLTDTRTVLWLMTVKMKMRRKRSRRRKKNYNCAIAFKTWTTI